MPDILFVRLFEIPFQVHNIIGVLELNYPFITKNRLPFFAEEGGILHSAKGGEKGFLAINNLACNPFGPHSRKQSASGTLLFRKDS
jgi:hypothetical protein